MTSLNHYPMWRNDGIFDEIFVERIRQHAKFGEQNHPNGTGHSNQIAQAEIARARCDAYFSMGIGAWDLILLEEVWEALAESDPEKLRTELVQVAAVAVAWIEAIDRKRGE